MKKMAVILAAAFVSLMCAASEALSLHAQGVDCASQPKRIVRDVVYDGMIRDSGLGDLYLPKSITPETPVVLAIHGGGWSSGDRFSWSGVAEFFWQSLGCVVFNIEYRLSGSENRWPACGDDCVKAANWLFSGDFRKRTGFTPRAIYICGGSSGGHLSLWTLVNLPRERVAGCISISSIGDPVPDFKMNKGRYVRLFGEDVSAKSLELMNPISRIKSRMAPVLCTHTTEDPVVPISSHKAFAEAYRAVGNQCAFYEYPSDKRLIGHCIWIPGSTPHRLIPEIEAQITAFMKKTVRN